MVSRVGGTMMTIQGTEGIRKTKLFSAHESE